MAQAPMITEKLKKELPSTKCYQEPNFNYLKYVFPSDKVTKLVPIFAYLEQQKDLSVSHLAVIQA